MTMSTVTRTSSGNNVAYDSNRVVKRVVDAILRLRFRLFDHTSLKRKRRDFCHHAERDDYGNFSISIRALRDDKGNIGCWSACVNT